LGTSSGAGYPTANQHGNIFAFTGSATFVKKPEVHHQRIVGVNEELAIFDSD
jgi:hypothetical protein